MGVGVVDAHRLAQGVARADENTHFQFVVQPFTGAENGFKGVGGLGLSQGAVELLTGDADGGTTAVVADGHPLVIGHQGIVGTEQPADVGGVMDGSVEVRIVSDVGGHLVFRLGPRNQAGA